MEIVRLEKKLFKIEMNENDIEKPYCRKKSDQNKSKMMIIFVDCFYWQIFQKTLISSSESPKSFNILLLHM